MFIKRTFMQDYSFQPLKTAGRIQLVRHSLQAPLPRQMKLPGTGHLLYLFIYLFIYLFKGHLLTLFIYLFIYLF